MIVGADTFFVASYADNENGARRVDVSHRGGRPGFVHVAEDGVLTIPDYAGNLFFNTLGNLLLNPRGGLVFAGFDTGDLLQLSGDTEIILNSPEIKKFEGAERLWRSRRAASSIGRMCCRCVGGVPHDNAAIQSLTQKKRACGRTDCSVVPTFLVRNGRRARARPRE